MGGDRPVPRVSRPPARGIRETRVVAPARSGGRSRESNRAGGLPSGPPARSKPHSGEWGSFRPPGGASPPRTPPSPPPPFLTSPPRPSLDPPRASASAPQSSLRPSSRALRPPSFAPRVPPRSSPASLAGLAESWCSFVSWALSGPANAGV